MMGFEWKRCYFTVIHRCFPDKFHERTVFLTSHCVFNWLYIFLKLPVVIVVHIMMFRSFYGDLCLRIWQID